MHKIRRGPKRIQANFSREKEEQKSEDGYTFEKGDVSRDRFSGIESVDERLEAYGKSMISAYLT